LVDLRRPGPDRRFRSSVLVGIAIDNSDLRTQLVGSLSQRLVLGLLENVRLEVHNLAVLKRVADLNRVAAHLAVLYVGLTLDR
jgi:hypothetical protein